MKKKYVKPTMKMGINDTACFCTHPGFITREIAGELLLVPIGEQTKTLNGMITFSETGAFILKHLDGHTNVYKIARLLAEECDENIETVLPDVRIFLHNALMNNLIISI